MKNWQTYNYADLETMLAKHRREAFVSCDKKMLLLGNRKILVPTGNYPTKRADG